MLGLQRRISSTMRGMRKSHRRKSPAPGGSATNWKANMSFSTSESVLKVMTRKLPVARGALWGSSGFPRGSCM